MIAHFIANAIKPYIVNLARLANAFDTDTQFASNYKRLQRFFRFSKNSFSRIDVVQEIF
uniref:Uncharacterized protein n=1 Tax=Candidatus Kentrum eta TaxID=2126337 RepID=A0A450V355_9GAMM|nr:MAG: hypothetical protein BECKH772C_GA0070978_100301 [Candidatus Kentron sp. H]